MDEIHLISRWHYNIKWEDMNPFKGEKNGEKGGPVCSITTTLSIRCESTTRVRHSPRTHTVARNAHMRAFQKVARHWRGRCFCPPTIFPSWFLKSQCVVMYSSTQQWSRAYRRRSRALQVRPYTTRAAKILLGEWESSLRKDSMMVVVLSVEVRGRSNYYNRFHVNY